MLVSHDRAPLRAVCDEFWMVTRGGVEPFDGDLDDYQRYLPDEAKRQREEAKRAGNAATAAAQAQAKQAALAATAKAPSKASAEPEHKQWKKQLQQTEARMQLLNTQRESLETQLGHSATPAQLADWGKQLKAVTAELAELEDTWLNLSSQLEETTA
jgi:ATP-binding cassette subfamily F protein 3